MATDPVKAVVLAECLARQPKYSDDLTSTWCPPDWEQLVELWDRFVQEARDLTGETYRRK